MNFQLPTHIRFGLLLFILFIFISTPTLMKMTNHLTNQPPDSDTASPATLTTTSTTRSSKTKRSSSPNTTEFGEMQEIMGMLGPPGSRGYCPIRDTQRAIAFTVADENETVVSSIDPIMPSYVYRFRNVCITHGGGIVYSRRHRPQVIKVKTELKVDIVLPVVHTTNATFFAGMPFEENPVWIHPI
eukprot:PhF_6_TR8769/c0_g1_i2/m.13866